jgi:hypothetical protein
MEEHSLRVFENRMLMRIFGPKKDEVIGWDGMDWIDLTQDRDQWGALVSAVMNLRVP